MLPTHRQQGRVANGALAVATAAYATTLRAWIGLLNVSERVNVARRRKAGVLVRAASPVRGACERVTVTVTGLEPREG
jgi:hypothetical protein